MIQNWQSTNIKYQVYGAAITGPSNHKKSDCCLVFPAAFLSNFSVEKHIKIRAHRGMPVARWGAYPKSTDHGTSSIWNLVELPGQYYVRAFRAVPNGLYIHI
jgi:hypothetical protein